MHTKSQGFTLIELMISITIIGILASTAMPLYFNWVQSAKITRAITLTDSLKPYVNNYYVVKESFPSDNQSAGIPAPKKLLSPEVSRIDLVDGAFHITLSESHKQLKDKIISVRPVYVEDSPQSPISWICGNAKIPKGMQAAGKNRTNVPYTLLPIQCRDLSGDTARKAK